MEKTIASARKALSQVSDPLHGGGENPMKVHKFLAAAGTLLAVFVPTIALLATQPAQAQTYGALYTFKGNKQGAGRHGTNPAAGLITDKKGNLYGTTLEGGAYGR